MFKKIFIYLLIIFASFNVNAQSSYVQEINIYQQNYVAKHEVVTETDKKYFSFFEPNEKLKLEAKVTYLKDTVGFLMKTSGWKTPRYFKYALLSFKVDGIAQQLTAYQNESLLLNEEYKDMLFIPFTDASSGIESYGGGRYLEIYLTNIKNHSIELDFNKVYNPYCAYAGGYNCPIPPAENNLLIAVNAGEKNFEKPYNKAE